MKRRLGPKPLLYPAPVLIVGAYDAQDKPNIMCCSWGGIVCSEPPCIGVSLREATYTYGCIQHSKAFSINIFSASEVKTVDYIGLCSGRDTDKFAAAGLTPQEGSAVHAPLAAECPLTIECSLKETVVLGLHTLFIGEVKEIEADESILDDSGHIDTAKLQPLAFDPGAFRYYRIGGPAGKAFSVGRRD